MGRRGPPPTPTPVLKMRGSWRANERKDEPEPEKGRPPCPAWLDTHSKSAWKQLIPMLEEMGVLAKIDGKALARYCRLWTRWRKAEEFIMEHGTTYPAKRPDGSVSGVAEFPQVGQADKLCQLLVRLEQEFGLTPSARARLQAPKRTKSDDAAEDRLFEKKA